MNTTTELPRWSTTCLCGRPHPCPTHSLGPEQLQLLETATQQKERTR